MVKKKQHKENIKKNKFFENGDLLLTDTEIFSLAENNSKPELQSDLDKELSYMQESLQILKDGNAKLREAVNKLTTFTVPEIDKMV